MATSRTTNQPLLAQSVLRRPVNWPLRLGWFIVGVTLFLAVAGPWLAPYDPLERFSVLNINGVWTGPPFPPFTQGFWLGTDSAGRDLFSRLLWAIRPTLIMVSIIALARLLIAAIVGMAAGWVRGWAAAPLDGLITGALMVPVLVVALAVIAFVGIQRGLLAFILGLTLTGWAESARYLETQTRALHDLQFMEAARVAGASERLVLVNHVLRHMLPQMGMLFAAEVSATLMVTAALGFLGYFIGGGVWVTVTDFSARNEAASPELGQLLATSLEQILRPWPTVVVGGAVVLIILGFNLLGDGLRRRIDDTYGRSATRLEHALGWLAALMVAGAPAGNAGNQAAQRRGGQFVVPGLAALLVVALAGWWLWPVQVADPAQAAVATEAWGHGWASARHDAAGTLTSSESGPLAPSVVWSYTHTAGFVGGPVVDKTGNIYIGTDEPALLALDAEGKLRWQHVLPSAPVGAPALDAEGRIYVVDTDRGLTAFGADGTQLWHYIAPDGPRPVSGPIVGRDGRIYFAQAARVRAVDATGSNLWLTQAGQNVLEQPPRLSLDGSQVFLTDRAFATADGAALPAAVAGGAEFVLPLPGYVVGADGNVYFVQGTTATRIILRRARPCLPVPPPTILAGSTSTSRPMPASRGILFSGSFTARTTRRCTWFGWIRTGACCAMPNSPFSAGVCWALTATAARSSAVSTARLIASPLKYKAMHPSGRWFCLPAPVWRAAHLCTGRSSWPHATARCRRCAMRRLTWTCNNVDLHLCYLAIYIVRFAIKPCTERSSL